jgi:TolA-binding protein
MEQSIVELSKLLQAMQSQNESIKSALEANTTAVRDLSSWRPHIEADVGDLRVELRNLSTQVKELTTMQSEISEARKMFELGSQEKPSSINNDSMGITRVHVDCCK